MPIITPSQTNQSAQPATTPVQSARERAISMLQSSPSSAQTQATPAEVLHAQAAEVVQSDSSEATPEPAKVAADAPKEAETPLSTQYAVLARKEKALRSKVQELRAKEDALKAREEAAKTASQPSIDESKYIPKERLTQDTLAVLEEMGISYDQLTNLILNQPKLDPASQAALSQMKAEIKALRDAQDDARKGVQTQQEEAYKQAVNQIRLEAKQLVSSDPVAYEAIHLTNSVNDVVELIEETFKQDGVLLSVEDAAKEVEDYLAEEAFKLAKLKKIQQKLQPVAPAPKKQDVEKQQPQMKTLTNAVGTQRKLSARERALLAFKGELKS